VCKNAPASRVLLNHLALQQQSELHRLFLHLSLSGLSFVELNERIKIILFLLFSQSQPRFLSRSSGLEFRWKQIGKRASG
jgi:hypothetical protein